MEPHIAYFSGSQLTISRELPDGSVAPGFYFTDKPFDGYGGHDLALAQKGEHIPGWQHLPGVELRGDSDVIARIHEDGTFEVMGTSDPKALAWLGVTTEPPKAIESLTLGDIARRCQIPYQRLYNWSSLPGWPEPSSSEGHNRWLWPEVEDFLKSRLAPRSRHIDAYLERTGG